MYLWNVSVGRQERATQVVIQRGEKSIIIWIRFRILSRPQKRELWDEPRHPACWKAGCRRVRCFIRRSRSTVRRERCIQLGNWSPRATPQSRPEDSNPLRMIINLASRVRPRDTRCASRPSLYNNVAATCSSQLPPLRPPLF